MLRIQKKSIVALGLIALVGTTTSGCAIIGGLQGVTVANMKAARDRGDAATLKKHCDEGKARATRDIMRAKATDAEVEACRLHAELEKANTNAREAEALAAYESALTCDNAVESFSAYVAEWKPNEGEFAQAFKASGRKLHECDDYKILVERLFPLGRTRGLAEYTTGYSLLKEMSAENLPVGEKLSAFASTSKFSFTDGWRAAAAITRWLIENEVYEPCDSFVGGVDSTQVGAVQTFTVYHGRARCKKAVQPLVKHLTSENNSLREDVCIALGRIGDPSVKAKLEIIATSDSAYTTERGVKHYYVRAACSDALNKLLLAE